MKQNIYRICLFVCIASIVQASERELLQEAFTKGRLSACGMARAIHAKHGTLFQTAVNQCEDHELLRSIAGEGSCGIACLKILRERHVNLDMPDKYQSGRTPLHQTLLHFDLYSGSVEKTKYLLDAGAEISKKDVRGETPFDLLAWQLHNYMRIDEVPKAVKILPLLQQHTKKNLLDPTQYSFYTGYLELVAQGYDSWQCWRSSEKECERYRACALLFRSLKKAEKRYFSKNS